MQVGDGDMYCNAHVDNRMLQGSHVEEVENVIANLSDFIDHDNKYRNYFEQLQR